MTSQISDDLRVLLYAPCSDMLKVELIRHLELLKGFSPNRLMLRDRSSHDGKIEEAFSRARNKNLQELKAAPLLRAFRDDAREKTQDPVRIEKLEADTDAMMEKLITDSGEWEHIPAKGFKVGGKVWLTRQAMCGLFKMSYTNLTNIITKNPGWAKMPIPRVVAAKYGYDIRLVLYSEEDVLSARAG